MNKMALYSSAHPNDWTAKIAIIVSNAKVSLNSRVPTGTGKSGKMRQLFPVREAVTLSGFFMWLLCILDSNPQ